MFFHALQDAGQIAFFDCAASWQDAIRLSCAGLIANGAVDADYPEQIIACVEKFGPYIAILPDLAIPHCNEGNPAVHRSTVAFTKFREAVTFPFPSDTRSARVFFTLAAADPETHVENMGRLFQILSDEEVLRQILEADSAEALLRIDRQIQS